jgi:hypothetical protein
MTSSPENGDAVHTWGGGSIKWNCSKSWTPRDLSNRTVLARFVRCISGTVVTSSSSLYCRSVYNLKQTNTLLHFQNHRWANTSLPTVLGLLQHKISKTLFFLLVLKLCILLEESINWLTMKKGTSWVKCHVTTQNTLCLLQETAKDVHLTKGVCTVH